MRRTDANVCTYVNDGKNTYMNHNRLNRAENGFSAHSARGENKILRIYSISPGLLQIEVVSNTTITRGWNFVINPIPSSLAAHSRESFNHLSTRWWLAEQETTELTAE